MHKHIRRTLSLLVCIALMLSMLPLGVLAADASFELSMVPSVTVTEIGNVITYQVYGKGTGITALQFNLDIPEGVTYVQNSAVVPEGLMDTLGWAATDWTEETMIWTGYTSDPTEFPEGTLLLTFSCVMDTDGVFTVDFSNPKAYDADFVETPVSTTTISVLVSEEYEPEIPPIIGESSFLDLSIRPCEDNVPLGAQVTFEVYAHGEGVIAMSFVLDIPEGMSYVADSAAIPEDLKSQLGIVGALDWTDVTLMLTMFNDVDIDIPEDTLLLTFTCSMDQMGEHQVNLKDLEAYDCNYDAFAVNADTQSVLVEGTPTEPELSFMNLSIRASANTAKLGDTVTFEVYGHGKNVVALQFNLDLPADVHYVDGATPDGLNDTLGIAGSADWTGENLLWTLYNDVGIDIASDTLLLTFTCTMDAVGEQLVDLTSCSTYDGDYNEMDASIESCSVLVEDVPIESFMDISIKASAETAFPGDTVTFSVYGHGENICAMQFTLDIPEGLSYNAGSGSLPENLKSQLGISGGLDWTDDQILWTMYNDVCIDIPEQTLLLTFTCNAEPLSPGEKAMALTELYVFDTEKEFAADVTSDTVTVYSGVHSYNEEILTAATCTEGGLVRYECSECGSSYTEIIAPLGHDFIGSDTCTRCGVLNPELTDSYFTAVVTASKTTAYVRNTLNFTVYGSGADLISLQFELAIPEGMTYVEGSGTVPAGLKQQLGFRGGLDWTEDSMMWTAFNDTAVDIPENTVLLTFSCTLEQAGTYQPRLCELEATNGNWDFLASTYRADEITVLDCAEVGHNWVDATCEADKYCSNCEIVEEGTALGHLFGEAVTTKAPTCTADGEQVRTCVRCPETQTESIPMTGHNYQAKVTAPTCTAEGYTTHTCANCGDTYKDTKIDPLGHNEQKVTVQPTCTEAGSDTYTCTRCGNQRVVEIPATGHSYSSTVVAPTCTVGGYTRHDCQTCGHSYQDNQTPATGHSYRALVTPPTATEWGYTTYTCSTCNYSYEDNPTPPLGMTLSGNFKTYRDGEVTLELVKDGTIVHSITVSGTSGSYTIPGVLPDSYTLKVSKKDHKIREYAVTVDTDPTTQNVDIRLLGDINGDGRLTVADVSRAYAHAKKTTFLEGYDFQVCDVNNDGKVTVADVSRLYAHAKKTSYLW